MPTFRFDAPPEILDPPLHRNCRLKSIGMTKPSILPPVTECGKVMFSVMCVCQFMGVGLYVTTMNLFKLVPLGTSLSPTQHGTPWSWPWPPTCSNVFTWGNPFSRNLLKTCSLYYMWPIHLSASGRLAFNWKAFLLLWFLLSWWLSSIVRLIFQTER